jgi:hypothetical protein
MYEAGREQHFLYPGRIILHLSDFIYEMNHFDHTLNMTA